MSDRCPNGNGGCDPRFWGYYNGTDYAGYYKCPDCIEQFGREATEVSR